MAYTEQAQYKERFDSRHNGPDSREIAEMLKIIGEQALSTAGAKLAIGFGMVYISCDVVSHAQPNRLAVISLRITESDAAVIV